MPDSGWQKHDTLVIDRDLGLTGKTAADRPGFQELVGLASLAKSVSSSPTMPHAWHATVPTGISSLTSAGCASVWLATKTVFTILQLPMGG